MMTAARETGVTTLCTVVHEHWDGCARPRNVDYGTRRLGDREPYPSSHGSGSPGGVYPGAAGASIELRGHVKVT